VPTDDDAQTGRCSRTDSIIESRKRRNGPPDAACCPLKNSPTVANPILAALLHELNQPLTAILSNAQAAQRHLLDSLAQGSSNRAASEGIPSGDGRLDHHAELRNILADIVADDKKAAAIIKRLTQAIKDAEDE
jgi:hypothetical protein